MIQAATKRKPAATGTREAEEQTALHPWGTQSIHRAITILREIAMHGQKGQRLADIADALA
jgi:hypothetical protein